MINAQERCRPLIVLLFRHTFCTHLVGRKDAGAVCNAFMQFEAFQRKNGKKEKEKTVLFSR